MENQGTWIWAYDLADEHAVFEREPGGESDRWTAVDVDLPTFLNRATMLNAALSSATQMAAENVNADFLFDRSDYARYSLGTRWPGPDSQILVGSRWVALLSPIRHAAASYDLVVAGRASDDLNWIDPAATGCRVIATSDTDAPDIPLPW